MITSIIVEAAVDINEILSALTALHAEEKAEVIEDILVQEDSWELEYRIASFVLQRFAEDVTWEMSTLNDRERQQLNHIVELAEELAEKIGERRI